MILSKSHQFVFIHIFKTAGTSIKRAIRRYAMPGWQEQANFVLKRIGVPQFGPPQTGDHTTASALIELVDLEEFNRLFSFAFVRNPWDWELSHYKYICKNRRHANHEEVQSLSGFQDYVRWRCDGRFMLQQDFLMHEEKQVVDFVGRFENLESDFRFVCRKIGIRPALPRLNRSTVKKEALCDLQAAERPYRVHYNDATERLVAGTYQKDIDRFAYEF